MSPKKTKERKVGNVVSITSKETQYLTYTTTSRYYGYQGNGEGEGDFQFTI